MRAAKPTMRLCEARATATAVRCAASPTDSSSSWSRCSPRVNCTIPPGARLDSCPSRVDKGWGIQPREEILRFASAQIDSFQNAFKLDPLGALGLLGLALSPLLVRAHQPVPRADE